LKNNDIYVQPGRVGTASSCLRGIVKIVYFAWANDTAVCPPYLAFNRLGHLKIVLMTCYQDKIIIKFQYVIYKCTR